MRRNLNFAKVNEDRQPEYAPIPLVINGENVWTNIAEKYIECGYYPIERTESPEKEGVYYTDYWVIEDGKCAERWEEHEEPADEADSAGN